MKLPTTTVRIFKRTLNLNDGKYMHTMSFGKSLALSKDTFLSPPRPKNEEKQPNHASQSRRKRRANLYDAVAGWRTAQRFWQNSC
jgi:hypothetical protein